MFVVALRNVGVE